MSAGDRAWLEGALDTWRRVERQELLLDPQPLPTVIAIDSDCTYRLPEGRFDRAEAAPHGETVTLPDGNEAALGPISFASGGAGGYFAMSLPSVWREAGVTSEVGLERLMEGVLLHEIMHTRQSELATGLLDPLAAGAGVPADELTDESCRTASARTPPMPPRGARSATPCSRLQLRRTIGKHAAWRHGRSG